MLTKFLGHHHETRYVKLNYRTNSLSFSPFHNSLQASGGIQKWARKGYYSSVESMDIKWDNKFALSTVDR